MLWSVVSRAGSYEELRDALNLTLLTMLQQDIRPFIYSGKFSCFNSCSSVFDFMSGHNA
jgi:hypothetical protein